MVQSVSEPDPRSAFAFHLRELRRQVPGSITDETIARQAGCSRPTISAVLNARRFPSWEITAGIVRALDGDVERFRSLWRAKRDIEEGRRREQTPELPDIGADRLGPGTPLSARWYKNHREFYEAAAAAARQATAEIRTTYIRRYPPTQYTTPAAAAYFETILNWAREPAEDERSVRRIIGIPGQDGCLDPEILKWVRRHHDETGNVLNYEATAMLWSPNADGLNMALIDDNVVFLAFSGGPRQKLNGFSVSDRTFMTYFAAYFDQLWLALKPLSTFLEDLDGSG
ncbi:helix-turn-helix domain-containing protein [Streptomyces sp. NPDC058319]|uniref:helix-turn-helix domain-containing protein n=1 Tax=unclassified Streptomyces TaxID=2593676 RepID=UPI0036E37B93